MFFLPCMISLLKTQDILSALVCWQFQCYRVFKQQILYECNMHPRKCSIETRIAFVYRFRNMIEILVALYYILISLVFPGLRRVGTYHNTLWSDYKGISILKFQTFMNQLGKYLQISCYNSDITLGFRIIKSYN